MRSSKCPEPTFTGVTFTSSRRGRRKRTARPVMILAFVLLLLVAVIQIYPLIWLVFFSLKDNIDIYAGNIMGLPTRWHFENYQQILLKSQLLRYFLNSVLVSALTILISTAGALMVSFALTRLRWRLKGFFSAFFLLGMMIPVHAALLPVFLTLQKLHLLNTLWALVIPYSGFALPFAILVLSGFMRGIPKEMEESAFIDGAGVFYCFRKIIVPLMKPAVATVTLFTFLSSWNELMFAVTFINKSELKTLTVGIMSLVGQHSTDWGALGAGLVLATLPTVLLYLFLSQQMERSLIAGAVKG